jgi:DNA modification methylase
LAAESDPPRNPAESLPDSLERFAPRIIWQKPDDLPPAHRNARTHSDKQIAQLAASIRTFGFTNPVLIGADDNILAGHGRVAAAKMLGLTDIPTIRLDHLTESERRAYVIADNRLAELAGWDRALLAVEFQELTQEELGFEIEITGFETAEIDLLIEEIGSDQAEAVDQIPAHDPSAPQVTRCGDLWILGEHRLMCGNALEPRIHERLAGGEQARAVFIDPPYNVPIDGHVSGSGRIRHREFAMASGELTEAEFTDFLHRSLSNLAPHCTDGAVFFVCIDWRHLYELQTAARQAELLPLNLCVWAKTNAGMGSFYRSHHELVLVLKKGSGPHINNVQLGQYGRYRTNLWTYEGANSIRPSRRAELALHPTVKPTALVADAIKDVTRRGDLVLDSFAGSGTTILAAENTGRRCYAIELDPAYVDVAIRRWQDNTGEQAVHAESGSSFEQIANARATSAPQVRRRRRPLETEG